MGFNTEHLQFAIEGGPRQPESLRGTFRLPTTGGQRLKQQSAFKGRHRGGMPRLHGKHRRCRFANPDWLIGSPPRRYASVGKCIWRQHTIEISSRKLQGIREHGHFFQHVLQFAHIAAPGTAAQPRQCIGQQLAVG